MTRAPAILLAATAVLVATGAARADAKDQCIAESETGQRLFLERHFLESRPHLVACGRAECPAIVTRDCVERLKQVEASLASVLVSATTSSGVEATDVRVFVDEASVARRPSGEALTMNPGPHRFRFERPGSESIVRQVTVSEGARLQSVSVIFAEPAPDPSAPGAATTSPQRTIGYVVAGTGVLAVATGIVFGLLASSSLSKERTACPSPTDCPDHAGAQRDYEAASTFGTVSTIAFVAGGALVAAGAVSWLTAPPSGARSAPAVGITPRLSPREGGFALEGAF